MDTVTQDIVLILEPYVPEIAPSVLAAMIDSIAPVHRTRRRLFIAISKRPGILTGEDRTCRDGSSLDRCSQGGWGRGDCGAGM